MCLSALLLYASTLLGAGDPVWWTASRFGDPGDLQAGGLAACATRLSSPIPLHHCAHRQLPCGTIIFLSGPNGLSWCVVADRGPYGAVWQGQWKLKTSAKALGRWRGDVDLSPIVADELGVTRQIGIAPVSATVLPLHHDLNPWTSPRRGHPDRPMRGSPGQHDDRRNARQKPNS